MNSNMIVYCFVSVLVGLCVVSSYPLDDWSVAAAMGDPYTDSGSEVLFDDAPMSQYDPAVLASRPYVPLSSGVAMLSKRAQSQGSARKRATLSQLLRRLMALYGDDDIHFSGRSSHVRFGAGGR
ncbi:uncharacterized protein LOC128229009 [Mya arenaria]|uniref:uncharacterized protein LOC128229009 n=1 Tax=Mya arenaria TaxID=6604 RepID=UPI0022E4D7E5|nr:uncharacterized protein LOC128229009 [Mya arenaria]